MQHVLKYMLHTESDLLVDTFIVTGTLLQMLIIQ